MPVRIRLQRKGANKKPFYHIVVADGRAPRDGKFIKKIGTYNPLREPPEIKVQTDLYDRWVRNGAQPSKAVEDLVRKFKKSQPPESPS